jgi:hypothetical protein
LTALDHASLVLVAVMMAAILAGVWRRHLVRLCRTFVVYALSVGLGAALIAAWPARFHTWDFWQFKELIYSVLSFVVALEIGALSFQAFPGARARARQLSVVILLATLIAIAVTPSAGQGTADSEYQAALYVELQPRLAHGTVMLLAAIWALVLWYVVPLHRWHRAILRGLLPYMLLFTVAVRLLVSWGWHANQWIGYADSVAYLAVLTYWAWEAWREEPPQPPSDIRSRLQPWLDKR